MDLDNKVKVGNGKKVSPEQLAEANRKIRRKFGRRRYLMSRYIPRYPIQVEREYKRVGRRYAKTFLQSVKKYSSELSEVNMDSADFHTDAMHSTRRRKAKQVIDQASDDFYQTMLDVGVAEDVDRIAEMAKRNVVGQWGKAVDRSLGVKIDRQSYLDKCTSVCSEWAEKSRAGLFGFFSGARRRASEVLTGALDIGKKIADAVRDIYNDFISGIAQLTQNAIGELNAMLSKFLQIDAGITKYQWRTMQDGRVRECHQTFDGKVFRWDDPPEIWYPTKHGVVYTGRLCHPGEDYNCRCIARPIFEIGRLHLEIVL